MSRSVVAMMTRAHSSRILVESGPINGSGVRLARLSERAKKPFAASVAVRRSTKGITRDSDDLDDLDDSIVSSVEQRICRQRIERVSEKHDAV